MTTANGPESDNTQRQKVKGLLSCIHLVAGSGVLVKGAIVTAAIIAGYSSVVYFHGRNSVSTIAEEVVKDETGIDLKFSEHMMRFSPE